MKHCNGAKNMPVLGCHFVHFLESDIYEEGIVDSESRGVWLCGQQGGRVSSATAWLRRGLCKLCAVLQPHRLPLFSRKRSGRGDVR